MATKYLGKYRNESTRLKNFDYGANAKYLITICTKHMQHYLGKIIDHSESARTGYCGSYTITHQKGKNGKKGLQWELCIYLTQNPVNAENAATAAFFIYNYLFCNRFDNATPLQYCNPKCKPVALR
jgi:hypothetical protein